MKDLLPYTKTKRQKEIINAIITAGSYRAAAKQLECARGTVSNTVALVREYAARQGYAPDHDLTRPVPDTHIAERVTNAYDEQGNLVRQWVKSNIKKSAEVDIIRSVITGLIEELPQYSPITYNETPSDDLMAVYPLGDPHVGMKAIADESGQDWTLDSARKVFPNIFGRAVNAAPSAKQAVIVNLGDYFHADNVAGVTTRSGHHLDTDGNFLTMADIGVEIMLCMVNLALQRHEHVTVINAIGNHDDTGSMFMQVLLKHLYANEPRLTIAVTANPYNFIRFGKCLFGVHHGHTTKADKLPLVMATDKAQDWGETEFRYWYTGHIHHDTLKEYSGCTVESFRTLAPKDAYASWGGYRSGQDTKALVLHKDYGEVERHTINIKQYG